MNKKYIDGLAKKIQEQLDNESLSPDAIEKLEYIKSELINESEKLNHNKYDIEKIGSNILKLATLILDVIKMIDH